MPMYDAPNGSKSYYVLERVGVGLDERYLHKLGKMFLIGEDPDRSERPRWSECKRAFRFDTYSAACHWLARWKPAGTHRVVYINEETDQFQAVDRPVEPERIDERDWQEFTHMNGRSN